MRRSVAWTRYRNRGRMTSPDGEVTRLEWLESAVLVKVDGQWEIDRLHSTPIADLGGMAIASRNRTRDVQRGFYVGLAMLMATIAVAGFWPSYWSPLLSGTLDLHWLLHLHGIVFTVWMAVFVTQAALVYRGRTDLHMTLGRTLGAGWALLLVTAGLAVSFGHAAPGVGRDFGSLAQFLEHLPIPLLDLVAFILLFGAGLVLTDRPEAHKRLMILATVALLAAPTARLMLVVAEPTPAFYGALAIAPLAPAFVAVGHDRWRHGRVHPAYWGGMVVLVANASKYFWQRSNAWAELSTRMADVIRGALLPLL